MERDYREVVQSWLDGNFDEATKAQIRELQANDPVGLEDAFYRNLEFGTGGLRGIMGVGTNRMNQYTVGMATQGLANYMKANCEGPLSVCISYDSRNNSPEFAQITANVLAANGIHVYIFDKLHPIALMSYSVRTKKATAGIMITASHNPKEYNGYKVFWSDGAQVTSPVDKDIVAEVAKITDPAMVKFEPGEDFQNADHTLTMIGTENGKTMLIQHNVMTPRPYSRMYQLTGTDGFANKYPIEQYCVRPTERLEGKLNYEDLNVHSAVSPEVKKQMMLQYKHPIHQELEERAKQVGGHGGMDFIMDYRLIYCLRNGLPLDMDVYDLAEWCSLAELSRISLENGNRPVAVPDFTRGSWNKVKGYRHAFAE